MTPDRSTDVLKSHPIERDHSVSVSRVSAFGALALTGVLALSACATENPAPSDGNTAAGDPTNAAVADATTRNFAAFLGPTVSLQTA